MREAWCHLVAAAKIATCLMCEFSSLYFSLHSCFYISARCFFFCCLKVSPTATCYHFLFTDIRSFEVEGKSPVSQRKRVQQRRRLRSKLQPHFHQFNLHVFCQFPRLQNNSPPRVQICSRSYVGNLLKRDYLVVVVFFFAVLNYSQNIEKLLRPSSIPS